MTDVRIRISESDLEMMKKEASKSQYEFDEFMERFLAEAMRPIRAKRAKAEMEENKRKWGY